MLDISSENIIQKYLAWNKQSHVKQSLWPELKLSDPSVYLNHRTGAVIHSWRPWHMSAH